MVNEEPACGAGLVLIPAGSESLRGHEQYTALVLTLGQAQATCLTSIISFNPSQPGKPGTALIPFLKKAFEAQREWLEGTELERAGQDPMSTWSTLQVAVDKTPSPPPPPAPCMGTVGSARTTKALPSTSPAAWRASWVPAVR